MDPLTILAVAKGSYEAIKAGISMGKEMQGMAKDLSNLWKACGDLTHAAAAPNPGLMSGKTMEQAAMEAYAAKAEALKMAAEIKNFFVGQYGLAAWDQVQSMVVNMRKEKKRLAAEEKKKKEEMMSNIATGAAVLLGIGLVAALMFLTIIFITHR